MKLFLALLIPAIASAFAPAAQSWSTSTRLFESAESSSGIRDESEVINPSTEKPTPPSAVAAFRPEPFPSKAVSRASLEGSVGVVAPLGKSRNYALHTTVQLGLSHTLLHCLQSSGTPLV